MYKRFFGENGAPFVLHQWNKLGFWAHHLLAYCLITIWGSTIRGFVVARFQGDLVITTLNSILVMGIAWILITSVFELVSGYYRENIRFEYRLLIAILFGSVLAAAITPIFSWMLGVMPVALEIGSYRGDIVSFMTARYPRVLAGMIFAIAPFWFVANWGWYAYREKAGVHSSLGQRRVAQGTAEAAAQMGEKQHERVTALPPAFMRKLPPEKRGILWAITAEQHYLRIYTNAGDDLVLMRFSDALDELVGVNGMQVHRSHWVSAEGFKTFSEEDRRLFIELHNSVLVPVSRPNYTAAKAVFAGQVSGMSEGGEVSSSPGATKHLTL